MKRAAESGSDGRQSIEILQQRYVSLRDQKSRSEANLETARKELERLQREAKEKYGTDDVEELRRKLDQMKADNEEKRRSYQADLDRIEQSLSEIESNDDDAGGNGE